MKSKQVVWATFTLINKSERCEKNPETVNNSQINVAGATFAFFIKMRQAWALKYMEGSNLDLTHETKKLH